MGEQDEIAKLVSDANELKKYAEEIKSSDEDDKTKAKKIKAINARADKLMERADKITLKESKHIKESVDEYDDLMEFIESADMNDPEQMELVESCLELME